MRTTDLTIYAYEQGRFFKVTEPHGPKDNANFVIVCTHGDYSGFLTLAEAEARLATLALRPDWYYSVVER